MGKKNKKKKQQQEGTAASASSTSKQQSDEEEAVRQSQEMAAAAAAAVEEANAQSYDMPSMWEMSTIGDIPEVPEMYLRSSIIKKKPPQDILEEEDEEEEEEGAKPAAAEFPTEFNFDTENIRIPSEISELSPRRSMRSEEGPEIADVVLEHEPNEPMASRQSVPLNKGIDTFSKKEEELEFDTSGRRISEARRYDDQDLSGKDHKVGPSLGGVSSLPPGRDKPSQVPEMKFDNFHDKDASQLQFDSIDAARNLRGPSELSQGVSEDSMEYQDKDGPGIAEAVLSHHPRTETDDDEEEEEEEGGKAAQEKLGFSWSQFRQERDSATGDMLPTTKELRASTLAAPSHRAKSEAPPKAGTVLDRQGKPVDTSTKGGKRAFSASQVPQRVSGVGEMLPSTEQLRGSTLQAPSRHAVAVGAPEGPSMMETVYQHQRDDKEFGYEEDYHRASQNLPGSKSQSEKRKNTNRGDSEYTEVTVDDSEVVDEMKNLPRGRGAADKEDDDSSSSSSKSSYDSKGNKKKKVLAAGAAGAVLGVAAVGAGVLAYKAAHDGKSDDENENASAEGDEGMFTSVPVAGAATQSEEENMSDIPLDGEAGKEEKDPYGKRASANAAAVDADGTSPFGPVGSNLEPGGMSAGEAVVDAAESSVSRNLGEKSDEPEDLQKDLPFVYNYFDDGEAAISESRNIGIDASERRTDHEMVIPEMGIPIQVQDWDEDKDEPPGKRGSTITHSSRRKPRATIPTDSESELVHRSGTETGLDESEIVIDDIARAIGIRDSENDSDIESAAGHSHSHGGEEFEKLPAEPEKKDSRPLLLGAFCVGFGLASLLFLVVMAILGLLSGKHHNKDEDDNPQLAPPKINRGRQWETQSTIDDILDLPDYTQEKIRDDRDSPQYHAFQWLKDDPDLDSYPDWRRQQRFALATLHYATTERENTGERRLTESGWYNDDGWLDYSDECQWFQTGTYLDVNAPGPCSGVAVDGVKVGELLHLWLVNNNLRGTLPPEIFLLTNLRSLDMEINSINGSLPLQVDGVKQMKQLSLGHNLLTGSLPPKLAALTDLTYLSLGGNKIKGELNRFLGKLSNLKALKLDSNQLTGQVPPEIGHLTDLESMDLSSNELGGTFISEIGTMSKLKEALLQKNRIAGTLPSEIGLLKNLEQLNVNNNQMAGQLPPELGHLPSLSKADLGKNRFTGTIPSEFKHDSKLTALYLQGNGLRGSIPADIFKLQKLSVFYAGGNNLSGTIPKEVTQSELSELLIYDNNLEGDIPSEIGLMTRLTTIGLHQNPKLSGSIPTEIGKLSRLKYLWLFQSSLTGRIPSELGLLSKLNILSIYSNHLTGSFPRELGSMSMLTDLQFHQNLITGHFPSELGLVSGLLDISAAANYLSGQIPSEMGTLTKLLDLRFYDNMLSSSIPAELGKLSALEYLSLAKNQLTGTIPAALFSDLQLMTSLRLDDNALSGSIPHTVGKMSSLRYLSLGKSPRMSGNLPRELGNLSQLTDIRIYETSIKGKIPKSISNLVNLQYISMVKNELTGKIPDGLFEQVTGLKGLALSENALTGTLPPSLTKHSNLVDLFLFDNRLSGSVPSGFGAGLSSMKDLQISKNKFTGVIPEDIGRMTSLIILDLESNKFTGTLTTAIGHLDKLEILWLANNTLSGDLPSELGLLNKLVYLNVSQNEFFSEIPASLGSLNKLHELKMTDNRFHGVVPDEICLLPSATVEFDCNDMLCGCDCECSNALLSGAAAPDSTSKPKKSNNGTKLT